MRFGKIPDKVALICAAKAAFKCGWEDVDISIAEDRELAACFVADAESPDTVATGRTWATHKNFGNRRADVEYEETVEENKPRKLWLVGLEKRQEGGRAFKVMDAFSRLFDLREDVLLETMIAVGCGKEGALNGEFIFARVGSQIRLIRVGSGLHAEMLKSEKRRTSSDIAVEDLEVGIVYANRKGVFIYLGRIDTVEEIFWGFGNHCTPVTAAGTMAHKKLSASGKINVVESVNVIGEHLSLPLSKWEKADPERALANCFNNGGNGLQFGKSITAVESVRSMTLPDNVLERLRMQTLERLDATLTGMEHPKYVDAFQEGVIGMKRTQVRNNSAVGNICAHGVGAKLSDEYQEALARCDRPLL